MVIQFFVNFKSLIALRHSIAIDNAEQSGNAEHINLTLVSRLLRRPTDRPTNLTELSR